MSGAWVKIAVEPRMSVTSTVSRAEPTVIGFQFKAVLPPLQ